VMERSVLLAVRPVLEPEDFADETRTSASAMTSGQLPFPSTLADLSRAAVEAMLALTGGNKSVAARRLGISRPRLQRLLDATPEDADTSLDPSDDENQRDD